MFLKRKAEFAHTQLQSSQNAFFGTKIWGWGRAIICYFPHNLKSMQESVIPTANKVIIIYAPKIAHNQIGCSRLHQSFFC
jgi:hypothetical protein